MKDKLYNVCDYVTNKNSNLKKHMKVHDKIKEEPVGPLHCPTCQKSLDGHEEKRGLKVKRNLGSDEHLKRALKSHISFNSLRVGSPKRVMSIRKNNSSKSPLTI